MAKIELQDFVKFGRLFEIYGNLLSEDRQGMMKLYFNFNMTLAEIAKEKSVSRQAVLDAISKSCDKLLEFEEKLNIMSKQIELTEDLENLKQYFEKSSQKELAEKVEKIMRKM